MHPVGYHKARRSLATHFGVFGTAVGMAVIAIIAACGEQLPAPLTSVEAGPLPPAWGLETRPVSTTCTGIAKPAAVATIGFERVSPIEFANPVGVVEQSGRLYVIQQGSSSGTGATIRVLGADPSVAPTVVDVSSRVVAGGEAGLLGLAFHPKFAQNRFVYLYFTAPHLVVPPPPGSFQSVIARYESPDGGLTLNLATEKRILVVDQPFSNHNGGTIAFGNDGFLYFGLGDGGSGGDPMNFSQNKNELLGKMVRIDVDGGDPYAIPPTNPFAVSGGRPEIYALGLRNPYRFSFDRPTGDLWVGDVGQGAREEIDKLVLGGNYGWNIREGKACYKPATGCPTTGLIDPVVDHPRSEARSIVGGVVYHGTKVPALTGKYVYGDTSTGFFFAIPTNDPAPTPVRIGEDLEQKVPVGFALDATGEIVFADYTGSIWRIVAPQAVPEMPAKLSETGCVDAKAPTKPAAGLFPYDVNVPQWVDGAIGERFLAIPGDAKLVTKPDGRLELPPGSVALRTLREDSRPIETQLLLRRADGAWGAFTYVWNAEGTDATLATGATTVRTRSGREHRIVDRAACLSCHNQEAGVTLGLEAAQIDREFAYADRPGNSLLTLDHLGMLSAPIPKEAYAPLPQLSGYDTVERRARAYLHGNCAFCHQGGDPANMDLRFAMPLPSTRTCDGKRLVAGNPAASTLVTTMRATDATRMPPFASALPHDTAITLLEDWIRSVPSCP